MNRYSRSRNYGDHDADNLTTSDGTHYTQPTGRRAELWATYHEVQRKSAEWFREMGTGTGTQNLPVKAIEKHHEIELLNPQI